MKDARIACCGLLVLAVTLICGWGAGAAEAVYTNPVLAGDYPDPSVIRTGKDFWATATSSEWGPHFPIMHSRDLVNWEVVGTVFDERPEWAVANFWAPEIVARRGKYYVYYVARKRGGPLAVAVASAVKPEGPYTDHGPIVSQDAGSIDPVIFDDESGKTHLIWKEDGNSRKLPTILWAAPLREDGTKLAGEPKELLRNDAPWEGAVVEGPFVVKRGGFFYLFYAGSGCCGSGCNYAVGVARSRALLGPWEKHAKNPIMAGNEAWRCPGHGSIVRDEQGRDWFMYHAYSARDFVFTGRQALLDEVIWAQDGWPAINNGKGPTSQARSPFNVPEKKAELDYADEFDAGKLRPGWNWPVDRKPPFRVDDGALVLSPKPENAKDVLGGILGRSISTGDFAATTALKVSGLKEGAFAGLAAVGDPANATGIALGDGKVIVWHRIKGRHEILATATAPSAATLHLRISATEGKNYQFAYGADGREWKGLGEQASGKHLPPWDRAVRVGLTVGGVEGAEGRFDFLHNTPRPVRR